jgi:hypothetical protein
MYGQGTTEMRTADAVHNGQCTLLTRMTLLQSFSIISVHAYVTLPTSMAMPMRAAALYL